jgi:hypothetical protein
MIITELLTNICALCCFVKVDFVVWDASLTVGAVVTFVLENFEEAGRVLSAVRTLLDVDVAARRKKWDMWFEVYVNKLRKGSNLLIR